MGAHGGEKAVLGGAPSEKQARGRGGGEGEWVRAEQAESGGEGHGCCGGGSEMGSGSDATRIHSIAGNGLQFGRKELSLNL